MKIVKTMQASAGAGRGQDNKRTPARWAVLIDGLTVCELRGTSAGYMETPTWEVYVGIVRIVGFLKSFRAAKQWVSENSAAYQLP